MIQARLGLCIQRALPTLSWFPSLLCLIKEQPASGVFVGPRGARSLATRASSNGISRARASKEALFTCVNCKTQESRTWRSDQMTGGKLCYACFTYAERHAGSPRPMVHEERRRKRYLTDGAIKHGRQMECSICHTTQTGNWHYLSRKDSGRVCSACYQYQSRHGGSQRPEELIARSKTAGRIASCVHCHARSTRRWHWNASLQSWMCDADAKYLARHGQLPHRSRPSDVNAVGQLKSISQSSRMHGPCKHCQAETSPQWHHNESLKGSICSADQLYLKRHGTFPNRVRPSDEVLAQGPCTHCKALMSSVWHWNEELQGVICDGDYQYLRRHGRLPFRVRPSNVKKSLGPCVHCNATTSPGWQWNEDLQGSICAADYKYLYRNGMLPHRTRPSDVQKLRRSRHEPETRSEPDSEPVRLVAVESAGIV